MSHKILKSVGLGYDPELTFDPLARTTVRIHPSLSKPFSITATKWDGHSRDTSSATAIEDKSKQVAELRVQALPSPAPSNTPTELQTRNETQVGDLHVPEPSGPQTLLSNIPVPRAPKSRSLSSDSESTLNNLVPVPFIDYIGNTCPHVRHSNFSKPLLLPGCAIQEVAGFSGWFTKKIKTDLEWERYNFTKIVINRE
jgi:hypothetical protein